MPLHPQVQRFQPLQEQERVERAHRRAEVAQQLRAGLEDVGELHRAERLEELHAVIARVGLGQFGELAVAPGEVPLLDDDAADRRAVPADELRAGVDDDVGALLERLAQDRRGERVVDDHRNAGVVGDLGDRLEVGHVDARVADRLDEDAARLVVDRLAEILRIGLLDELQSRCRTSGNV